MKIACDGPRCTEVVEVESAGDWVETDTVSGSYPSYELGRPPVHGRFHCVECLVNYFTENETSLPFDERMRVPGSVLYQNVAS